MRARAQVQLHQLAPGIRLHVSSRGPPGDKCQKRWNPFCTQTTRSYTVQMLKRFSCFVLRHVGSVVLDMPLAYSIFSLMTLIRDPIYQYFSKGLRGQPRVQNPSKSKENCQLGARTKPCQLLPEQAGKGADDARCNGSEGYPWSYDSDVYIHVSPHFLLTTHGPLSGPVP